jgi:hypothetical protein
MSNYRIVFVSAVLVALAGCGGGDGNGGSSNGNGSGSRTIVGTVPASGTTGTRDYGGVTVGRDGAGLHVAAYRLHAKGERGARVDVVTGADGRFRLDVDRGARYVVNVESADGHAALVTFGGSRGVLDIGVNGDGREINVGSLKVSGGVAPASVAIDSGSGVISAEALADEYFEAANGAIVAARDAVDAAIKATEAACSDAQRSLAAAQEACKLAGAACGTAVDEAKAETDAACAAANATLQGAR